MEKEGNLINDLQILCIECFKESEYEDQLSELLYEAIETTCGIKTSMQGYLSSAFVLNCMNLANSVKSIKFDEITRRNDFVKDVNTKDESKTEERFVQFIKDVLMQ